MTVNRNGTVDGPVKCDVTWSQGITRVCMNDKKARMCHIEAMRVKILRAHERGNIVRGNE